MRIPFAATGADGAHPARKPLRRKQLAEKRAGVWALLFPAANRLNG